MSFGAFDFSVSLGYLSNLFEIVDFFLLSYTSISIGIFNRAGNVPVHVADVCACVLETVLVVFGNGAKNVCEVAM